MTQQNNNAIKRGGFSSSFGVLAATLGSAVGLGNIWKFPYLTGANGGAGFLLVYLLATLVIGLPVMIAEITIGRHTKANPITALKKLSPKGQPWWLLGVAGMIAAFLILSFYSEVVAWVFAYIFKAIGGSILSNDRVVTEAAFSKLITDPVQSLLWQWAVLAFIGAILLLGVTKGIEGIAKKLMPLLLLLLLLLCAVSLSLDKARDGLAFLFHPDFSKINATVILTAMGLAFFKLSLGMGTMMTYGSYFRDDQNIPSTAVRVMAADLCVSMLAGIAIFPAVLAAVAATGAMLSLMEVPVVILHERFAMSRPKATLITIAGLMLIGSSCALTNNLMANFKLFGMNMFDLFDFVSSNLLLPIGGILISLFVGWVWGIDKFALALSNNGALANTKTSRAVFFLLRYVSPLLILLVMLKGLNLF